MDLNRIRRQAGRHQDRGPAIDLHPQPYLLRLESRHSFQELTHFLVGMGGALGVDCVAHP
jgi:hypothetical protein